jgi:G:T/U-mismatch repair DNA glycosylase
MKRNKTINKNKTGLDDVKSRCKKESYDVSEKFVRRLLREDLQVGCSRLPGQQKKRHVRRI